MFFRSRGTFLFHRDLKLQIFGGKLCVPACPQIWDLFGIIFMLLKIFILFYLGLYLYY